MKTFAAWLAILLACAGLAGCAGMPAGPVAEEQATTAAGYGRVFGRIVYVEDGKEKTWSTGTFALEVLPVYVRNLATGQMQRMEIKGDGSFLWPLPAGEHVLVSYHLTGPLRSGRLWTRFAIPAPGQAVYIGELRIELNRGRFALSVADHYDAALEKVRPQLAASANAPLRQLMQLEAPVGRFERLAGACAEMWGVPCENKILGVEPVAPAGATQGYPAVASLTPLLEWKPAGKPGIHYDVAVYESLTLTLDVPGAPRARGALLEYAEDLAEPRYQLTKPLPPGRKYDWSVRMRQGSTVSNWSTASYFAFFVVGWASGTGLWFGLATPEK